MAGRQMREERERERERIVVSVLDTTRKNCSTFHSPHETCLHVEPKGFVLSS